MLKFNPGLLANRFSVSSIALLQSNPKAEILTARQACNMIFSSFSYSYSFFQKRA